MDIYLQKPKILTIKQLTILFFALCLCFALFKFFYRFETKSLEETINDDLVWQGVKNLPISAKDLEKLITEIEGIKSKIRKGNPCKQYVLKAFVDGWYECFELLPNKIFLKKGEIWKIGKTCLEERNRYSGGLPDGRLLFFTEFVGTAEQCLIVEKVKLYAYVLSSENQSRLIQLKLPPGNKQYK